MKLCYLGLGSNLRSPQRQLNQAIKSIRSIPHSSIKCISNLYQSLPYGTPTQPNYCNMVLGVYTNLPPLTLLKYCQRIENQQLRVRKKHWGPRTLDIDILLYNNEEINKPNLIVPHPYMTHRDFVLVPLLELSPLAHLPNGRLLSTYLTTCQPYLIYSPN